MSRLLSDEDWENELQKLIDKNYNGSNNNKIVQKINLYSIYNELSNTDANGKIYTIYSPKGSKYTIQKNNNIYSNLKKAEQSITNVSFLSKGGKKQKRSRRKMTKRRSTKRRATRRR